MSDVFANAFPATPTPAGTFPSEDDVLDGVLYGPGDNDLSGNWRAAPAIEVMQSYEYGLASAPTTGRLALPADDKVIYPTGYGVDGTQYNGRWYVATDAVVQLGVNFGLDNLDVGLYDPGGVTPQYPGEDEVLEGVVFGDLPSPSLTGRWRPATASDVRFATDYGDTTSFTTGTCYVPAASDVRLPVNVDATTGTCVVPSPDDVRLSTSVDATVGNCRVPTADKVELNYLYDTNDTIPGTLDPGATGTIPDPVNVRFGVSVGVGGTGTLVVPAESDVRSPVTYDGGVQAKTGSCVVPSPNDVRFSVNVDATTGTCYVPAASDVRLPVNVDATTGTCVVPSVLNVRSGQSVDVAPTVGDLVVPSPIDVRLSVNYDSPSVPKTGQLDLPSVGDVRLDTEFDSTTKTGQLDVEGEARLPAIEEVLDAIEYGTVGNPYTGVYHGPEANEVYDQAVFGPNSLTSGTVSVPLEGNVLDSAPGYGPDSSMFGTYDVGGTGTIPDPSDVRLGTAVAQTTGTLAVPAPGEVLLGVDTDDTTGTLNVYDAANLPPNTRVISGITFGDGDVGNYKEVPDTQVVDGFPFGAGNGAEYTGSFSCGAEGIIPDITNVRFGIAVGVGQTGVLELPSPSQVQFDVGYGAYGIEYEGTLTYLPGGSSPSLPPVMPSGQLRSPLIVGDAYTGDKAFEWTTTPPTGWVIGTSTVEFRGTDCGCSTDEWSVAGTIAEVDGDWVLTVEMDTPTTALIEAGSYDWSVRLSDGSDVRTVEFGQVDWAC